MEEQEFRYSAFVSYRHLDRDRKWARWLVEKLETFRTPRGLVNRGVRPRIGKLFRDDDEIPASSDLSTQIEDALRQSKYLIVVCSSDTPASLWVQKEVEYFRRVGRGSRIFALLVEGEPREAFPPNLLRVPREQTVGESDEKIEWIDVEPIAADVRQRADEARSATEQRALLRIASGLLGVGYDDLVQRDQQRRARTNRVLTATAAALLLTTAVGGYEYWDYATLHTRYYRDYGTRWGAPFGIGEISAQTASRRYASYAVDTLRGHVIAMRRENGSHGLMPLPGDGIDGEAWEIGVAEWRFPIPADHAVQIVVFGQLDFFGRRDRKLRSEEYSWQPDGTAIVTFKDPDGAATTVRVTDFGSLGTSLGEIPRRSQIASHKLSFTREGLVSKRQFQTVWGAGARDAEGSFGSSYLHGEQGELLERRRLDRAGQPVPGKKGVLGLRQFYDYAGERKLLQWTNARGKPIAGLMGYASLRIQRDEFGNLIQEDFVGADGRPSIVTSLGASRETWRYDLHGNQVLESYFGSRGEPVPKIASGVLSLRRRYNSRGYVVEDDYLGARGQLVQRSNTGDAKVEIKYDQSDNERERAYFGVDGKPVRLAAIAPGAARITYRYDADGNEVEERYFGTDRRPVLLSDEGIAGQTRKFDRRGNDIQDDDFGIDGKPIPSKLKGYARITAKYDEQGNEVSEAYFGSKNEPVTSKDDGFWLQTLKYDDRGNEVEERYFSPKGLPVLNSVGIAHVVAKYDEVGNKVEESYFGLDDKPILNNEMHAARIEYRYNGEGDLLMTRRYGANGKPLKE